jgi:hypothetical protein
MSAVLHDEIGSRTPDLSRVGATVASYSGYQDDDDQGSADSLQIQHIPIILSELPWTPQLICIRQSFCR